MATDNSAGGSNVLSKLKKRFSVLSASNRPAAVQDAKSSDPTPSSAPSQSAPVAADPTVDPTTNSADVAPKPPAKDPPKPEASGEAATNTVDETPASHSYKLKTDLRQLYPAIEPFKTGMLSVDDTHSLYYEVCGKESGVPVVFLHGGPGGGIGPSDRRWFDPEHYCIYLFDQRGSGKSTPHANLDNNTTWDIVEDIEKLRRHVGVDKWHVFGGSWGSCLALAYAQTHPDRIGSLVLRGIFTLRRSELLFLYQEGTSHLFPEYFEPYLNHIDEAEQHDLMAAYYKRLTSDDEDTQVQAAKYWSTLENASSKLYVDDELVRKAEEDAKWAVAFARIECHFFVNAGWMDDGQLIKKENVDKIRHIPAVIVQGRYDVVCPAKTAYELHKQWPEAEFHMVPDCGHGSREPGNLDRLIKATDKMRSIAL